MRWPSESPGAWHLPEDATDDYCKQIVSEAKVRKPTGAPEWVQRSRNNHYLDCEAMQAGLAHWMRFDLIRETDPEPAPDEPSAKRARARKTTSAPAKSQSMTVAEKRAKRQQRLIDAARRLYGT